MNKQIASYLLNLTIKYVIYPIVYPLLRSSVSIYTYVKNLLHEGKTNNITFVKKHKHVNEYKLYSKQLDKTYHLYLLEDFCEKKHADLFEHVLDKYNMIYHACIANVCNTCETCEICNSKQEDNVNENNVNDINNENDVNNIKIHYSYCDECNACDGDNMIFSDVTQDIKKYNYYLDKLINNEGPCHLTKHLGKLLWHDIIKLMETQFMDNQPHKDKKLVLILFLNDKETNDIKKLRIPLH